MRARDAWNGDLWGVDYDEGLLYGIEDPNVHYHWAFVPQTLGLMVTDEMWDWLPEQ